MFCWVKACTSLGAGVMWEEFQLGISDGMPREKKSSSCSLNRFVCLFNFAIHLAFLTASNGKWHLYSTFWVYRTPQSAFSHSPIHMYTGKREFCPRTRWQEWMQGSRIEPPILCSEDITFEVIHVGRWSSENELRKVGNSWFNFSLSVP